MKNCLKEKVSQLSVLYKVFSTFFVVKALQLATMDVPQWKVIEVAAILNEISKRYMETHKIYFFNPFSQSREKWGKMRENCISPLGSKGGNSSINFNTAQSLKKQYPHSVFNFNEIKKKY